jgi:tetratricopeptide (TPR) repeat protein
LAIKSLEQEITVAPGNYYTYLLLADLYERGGNFNRFEVIIRRLLERDPGNIQGIHKLIRFCEHDPSHTDVELLRRKLLNRSEGLNRIEAVIRAYHLLQTGQSEEAIKFLAGWSSAAPDISIIHLANAHIYGQTHQYSKQHQELSCFKIKNHGREDVMKTKLKEFASVFGNEAAERLGLRLRAAYPNASFF